MAKYSALKNAKEKIKQLLKEQEELLSEKEMLSNLLADTRGVCQSLRSNSIMLSKELEENQLTFDKQMQTLKLAGETIRELQRSRKRLKVTVRVLSLVVTTMLIVGVITL